MLAAVNAVFADHPEGFDDFAPHTAEHAGLPIRDKERARGC